MAEDHTPSLLASYRVLDLTDEKGFFCGKVLSDMGADVIKIENPGGDAARKTGPFYGDEPHPEKSLFWLAYNVGKRGITLNIETRAGRDLLQKLVRKADFVIESFDPGYLDRLQLGYEALRVINPQLVLTSISPFGQDGPYAQYRSTDLVLQCMGGLAYITGDPDRPPVYWNQHLSYLFGSLEAACATLIAHFGRLRSGCGDHVDVSLHEALLDSYWGTLNFWHAAGVIHRRQGTFGLRGRTRKQCVWPCRDGLIVWQIYTGQLAWQMRSLIEWMRHEGKSGGLEEVPWEKMEWEFVQQGQIDEWEKVFADFFLTHTVAELYAGAVEIGTILYPVHTIRDLCNYPPLEKRGYWTAVDYPHLGGRFPYPGAAFKCSATPLRIPQRAPQIGEHNREIYENELALKQEDLQRLREEGII